MGGAGRQAGAAASATPPSSRCLGRSSPRGVAWLSRVLALSPTVCCLIARALATQSWISAPEVNVRIVLVETLLCVLRSYGKSVVNECGLTVNSAVLRFQGNSRLVHMTRCPQGWKSCGYSRLRKELKLDKNKNKVTHVSTG